MTPHRASTAGIGPWRDLAHSSGFDENPAAPTLRSVTLPGHISFWGCVLGSRAGSPPSGAGRANGAFDGGVGDSLPFEAYRGAEGVLDEVAVEVCLVCDGSVWWSLVQ